MLQNFTIKQQSRKALLFFFSLIIVGCSQLGPYVELEEPDPMPSGPGLFTGETGVIEVKRNEKSVDEIKSETKIKTQ